MAAACVSLGGEVMLRPLISEDEDSTPLKLVLPHIVREATDKETVHELQTLTQEVIDVLQGVVGVVAFTEAYSAAQSEANQRKIKKKVEKAQQVGNHNVLINLKIFFMKIRIFDSFIFLKKEISILSFNKKVTTFFPYSKSTLWS